MLLGIFFETEKRYPLLTAWAIPDKGRENMARQSQNKFIKRQKELERMRKAKEKMVKRQTKKDQASESNEFLTSDQPLPTSEHQE
jgi:hypothetical protein